MSLSAQILIKENHIAAFGGIPRTLDQVAKTMGSLDNVVIEVRNTDELSQAIEANVPIVMLDNFSPELVHRVCEWDRGETRLEVSGGVTLDNIGIFSHRSLDRISIGALTHSVHAPDITLLVDGENAGL